LKVSDLIDLKQTKGISIQDNDVILNPEEILPPPDARGSLTEVLVQDKTGEQSTLESSLCAMQTW
jgi:hypothetical protein